MKRLNKEKAASDELLPEYDLSKLKSRGRGKYAESYKQGTNLVLLEPDIAEAFPTAADVNKALRSLIPSNLTDRSAIRK